MIPEGLNKAVNCRYLALELNTGRFKITGCHLIYHLTVQPVLEYNNILETARVQRDSLDPLICLYRMFIPGRKLRYPYLGRSFN